MRKGQCAAVLVAFGAFALVGACTQLIGVEDIPSAAPDAGHDAARAGDATTDHATPPKDTGPRCESAADGGCVMPCEAGATRCTSDGLGMETCSLGSWGPVGECPLATPVCLGSQCACEPGAAQCAAQQWQECRSSDGGRPPSWQDVGDACAGTCTVGGCSAIPPSCVGNASGQNDCPTGVDGGVANQSCCTSNEVPGGAFARSYDAYSTGYVVPTWPATVSSFRLDRFEVTVGRFRRFVAALAGSTDGGVDGGLPPWRPQAGSGKHVHLNAGQGLVNVAGVQPTFERGWDPSWNARLDVADLSLTCGAGFSSWGGGNDLAAMNCVDWAAAYAFCIWDGGFLPSEAEWNYAAAGGAEQRIYPWSPSVAEETADGGHFGDTIDCANANYVKVTNACFNVVVPVGNESPSGDGKWGQTDLAGNVLEWTLDAFARTYHKPCTDCANLGAPPGGGPDGGLVARVQRGGGFVSTAAEVLVSVRGYNPEVGHSYAAGFRCARSP